MGPALNAVSKPEGKITMSGVIFSLLFSVVTCTEYAYQRVLSIREAAWWGMLMNVCFLFVVTLIFYGWVREKVIQLSNGLEEPPNNMRLERQYFILCTLITAAAYTFVFLAYYPGFNNYDAYNQILQNRADGYGTWHPVAHTLWLHFFLYYIGGKLIGDYSAGWAIGMYCQMLAFCSAIGYMHLFFYRMGMGKRMRCILVILFAFNPMLAILSVSSTKNILFSTCFLVMCVCIAYWTVDEGIFKKKRMVVLYVMSVAGSVLLLKNGIYGIIAMVLVGGIYMLRRRKYGFLISSISGLLIGLLCLGGLTLLTNARRELFTEAVFSVPYCQLAYVYNVDGDKLSDEEKMEILNYNPAVESYNPSWADSIWWAGKAFESHDNTVGFIKTYIKFGLRYPADYAESWLYLNSGYFYIWDIKSSEVQNGHDGNRWGGFLETEFRTDERIEMDHTSHFSLLEGVLEYLFTYNNYHNVFPIRIICSLALYFWAIMLSCALSIDLGLKQMTVLCSCVMGLMFTILLGPMVLARYALPYVLASPVVFVLVIAARADGSGER